MKVLLFTASLFVCTYARAYSYMAFSTSNTTFPQMGTSAIGRSQTSLIVAEDAARTLCVRRGGGSGCKLYPVVIPGQCVAVAADLELDVVYSAQGASQDDAQKGALRKCQAAGSRTSCSLRTSTCDYFSCERPDDYNSCLRNGDAIFPGSAKEFCGSQFC